MKRPGLGGLSLALALLLPVRAVRNGVRENGQLLRSQPPQQAQQQHWDYADNGASWSMGQCAAQEKQSPIDIAPGMAVPAVDDVLLQSYAVLRNPMKMHNNGKSLTMSLPEGVGGISLGADTWDAYEIIVHAPAEHTIGGSRAALELQIHHAKMGSMLPPPPSAMAIVALTFLPSQGFSGFLDALRQGGLPTHPGTSKLVNKAAPAKLDFNMLFQGGTFIRYEGSLTRPPCSSGVAWFVRSTPLSAAPAALEEYRRVLLNMASKKQPIQGNVRAIHAAAGIPMTSLTTQAVEHAGLPKQGDSVDPEFDHAVKEAASETKSFEKSLPKDGHLSQAEVARLQCAHDFAEAENSHKQAEEQQKVECAALEEAKKGLASAGDGVTRLQAVERVQAQEQLCKDSTEVVGRLRQEADALQQQCLHMQSNLNKKHIK